MVLNIMTITTLWGLSMWSSCRRRRVDGPRVFGVPVCLMFPVCWKQIGGC